MKDGLSELHPSRAVARRMHELESELQRARMHLRSHSKSPDTVGRWGLEQPSAPQAEEGWFITYLDLMTLLLVAMIVMLAFSGSITALPNRAPGHAAQASVTAPAAPALPEATPAKRVAAHDPALPAPGANEPPAATDRPPEATHDMAAASGGQTAVAVDVAGETPDATPTSLATDVDVTDESQSADAHLGAGLLPGGPGLLHGNTHMTTESVGLPSPATSEPPALLDSLYPGWTAADLAASRIGPPRPPLEGLHRSIAGTPPSDAAETGVQALAAAPTVTTPPSESPRSEGESVAAGLALSELGSDVQVVVNERSVSFRVNSEILFDSSQADLSRSGLAVLRRIAGVLTKAGYEVTVEGHTDAVPVRRNVRYPSNWELSSARAGSVVRYLQANGIARTRLKAVGYADTRPIGDNNTPDGRALNRRVELVIEKKD